MTYWFNSSKSISTHKQKSLTEILVRDGSPLSQKTDKEIKKFFRTHVNMHKALKAMKNGDKDYFQYNENIIVRHNKSSGKKITNGWQRFKHWFSFLLKRIFGSLKLSKSEKKQLIFPATLTNKDKKELFTKQAKLDTEICQLLNSLEGQELNSWIKGRNQGLKPISKSQEVVSKDIKKLKQLYTKYQERVTTIESLKLQRNTLELSGAQSLENLNLKEVEIINNEAVKVPKVLSYEKLMITLEENIKSLELNKEKLLKQSEEINNFKKEILPKIQPINLKIAEQKKASVPSKEIIQKLITKIEEYESNNKQINTLNLSDNDIPKLFKSHSSYPLLAKQTSVQKSLNNQYSEVAEALRVLNDITPSLSSEYKLGNIVGTNSEVLCSNEKKLGKVIEGLNKGSQIKTEIQSYNEELLTVEGSQFAFKLTKHLSGKTPEAEQTNKILIKPFKIDKKQGLTEVSQVEVKFLTSTVFMPAIERAVQFLEQDNYGGYKGEIHIAGMDVRTQSPLYKEGLAQLNDTKLLIDKISENMTVQPVTDIGIRQRGERISKDIYTYVRMGTPVSSSYLQYDDPKEKEYVHIGHFYSTYKFPRNKRRISISPIDKYKPLGNWVFTLDQFNNVRARKNDIDSQELVFEVYDKHKDITGESPLEGSQAFWFNISHINPGNSVIEVQKLPYLDGVPLINVIKSLKKEGIAKKNCILGFDSSDQEKYGGLKRHLWQVASEGFRFTDNGLDTESKSLNYLKINQDLKRALIDFEEAKKLIEKDLPLLSNIKPKDIEMFLTKHGNNKYFNKTPKKDSIEFIQYFHRNESRRMKILFERIHEQASSNIKNRTKEEKIKVTVKDVRNVLKSNNTDLNKKFNSFSDQKLQDLINKRSETRRSSENYEEFMTHNTSFFKFIEINKKLYKYLGLLINQYTSEQNTQLYMAFKG